MQLTNDMAQAGSVLMRWLFSLALVFGLSLCLLTLLRPHCDQQYHPKAITALAHQGTNGLSALIRILKTEDSAVDKINRYIWPFIPPRFPIQVPDPNVPTRNRVMAADALGQMGTNALPAIPSLVRALQDEAGDVSFTAALALIRIGPRSIPALMDVAKSRNKQVRQQATWALTEIRSRFTAIHP